MFQLNLELQEAGVHGHQGEERLQPPRQARHSHHLGGGHPPEGHHSGACEQPWLPGARPKRLF